MTSLRDRRVRLGTDRLTLEPMTLAAARAVLAGRPGRAVGRGWPHADTADALAAFVNHANSDEDGGWFVVLRESGEVIGEAGWKGRPGPGGRAEIGYGLAEPFRGRGLGTEALATLTDWMLARAGCRQLVAEVLADNLASRRVLEKVGFVPERSDPPYVWYRRDRLPQQDAC